jgi:membrane protease YdiL (CAAX protease family)
MNNNNEIIEFEDLFKEEIKQRNEPPKPEDKKNYMYAVFSYLLVMFFLNALLLAAITIIPNSTKEFTKNEIILELIITDVSGVSLMETDEYELYKQDYNGYVDSLIEYQGYEIIYNTANTYIKDLLLETNEITETITLKEDVFKSIYAIDETSINYWDLDQTLEITRYQNDDQSLPSFFLTQDVETVDYTGTNLTTFYRSLYQFVLYAILLALILRFLLHDLMYDFKLFKLIKNQWLVIIVTGYLYVLLGNYLSSFLSTFLSNAFSIPISESINQIAIVRMLNSDGVIFIVLSAVFIGPIVEELIFRKSIFGLIKNQKFALVLSAVIFGAIHLTSEASLIEALINGISYFTMGVIFGYIYLKNNKNIIAPIVIHILVNLVSVVASIILF